MEQSDTAAYVYMIYPKLVREYKRSDISQEKAEAKALQKVSDKKKAYVHEDEAKIVRMIFERHLEIRSIRTVTYWLNKKGIKTRFNASWSNITISRILKNPVYIGKICYNKRVSANGSHKRPKEQWVVNQYRHNDTGEDNADAHLKRQVMGRDVTVAITKGKLDFGPWEQIFYGEFDGRRDKRVLIKIIGDW